MKNPLSRRAFLETSLFAGASTLMASRLAFANAPTDARFVFVLLRGALDGLSAVPPVGDPDYAGLRGQIALAKSGEGAALPLDGPFGAASGARIPASQLRREGTRGVACRGHAVSRALAFRRAERARERRPASAWLDERLDQSRAGGVAGGQVAGSGRGARRQCAARDAWACRGGVLVADENRGARRGHAGAGHGSVCARSAAVAAPRGCAGERRHRQ